MIVISVGSAHLCHVLFKADSRHYHNHCACAICLLSIHVLQSFVNEKRLVHKECSCFDKYIFYDNFIDISTRFSRLRTSTRTVLVHPVGMSDTA